MVRNRSAWTCLLSVLFLGIGVHGQDTVPQSHGKRPMTLAIQNVFVIRGDGIPAYGPTNVYVRDGKITSEELKSPEVVLDGTGCYLLPGLVNTHGHLQEAAAGIPMPMQYQLNLWLASGITTVRDLGSTLSRSIRIRERSRRGEIAAPRIYLYQGFGRVESVAEARARVQAIKSAGSDGIKFWSNYSYPKEILDAALESAKRVGLPTTAHIGVGVSNALTYARAGITSLEHFYGIPDAALRGLQDFPPDFTYSNEVHRFRYAGRLWREADPERLDHVLAELVERSVVWSPTLAVYEASRDVQRAQTKPEFAEYLHPALAKFFAPSLLNHGSYFLGWTTTDEVYWKENYQIWMAALRRFADMGGMVTTGEDAGYIYLLYGFGLIREMELQQEAGFRPLEVIRNATWNGARLLGMDDTFGRILPGLAADMILVDGNPLANLKVLYPTGCDIERGGGTVRGGGVRYTIRDGWIYHGETLLREVRKMVAEAKSR